MTGSRLTHALGSGEAALPDGPVLVLRPTADADLSALDKERLTVVQGFRPDYDAWASRGYDCKPETGETRARSAIVFIPRAKDHARELVARALAATDGGPVIVDGQKTDGIESLIKAAKQSGLNVTGVLSMRHGKLATLSGPAPEDWLVMPKVLDGGWHVRPGVFSADGIDPGSA